MAEAQLRLAAELQHEPDRHRSVQVRSRWVANDQFVAVKNPNYWRKDPYGQQLPYLDQITFMPVTGPSAMLNGLQSKPVRLREHRRHDRR